MVDECGVVVAGGGVTVFATTVAAGRLVEQIDGWHNDQCAATNAFNGFERKEGFSRACWQNNRAETVCINPRLQCLLLIVVKIEIEFERRLDGFVLRNRCCVLDAVFTELVHGIRIVQRERTPLFNPRIPFKVLRRRFRVFSDNCAVIVAEVDFLFFAHGS